MASRNAVVKTPTPRLSIGADDRSPAVLMITNSAGCPSAMRASLIPAAWVVASRLPRVPIRITWANGLLGGRFWAVLRATDLGARASVEPGRHRRQFARGGDGVDGGLVEFEKLA